MITRMSETDRLEDPQEPGPESSERLPWSSPTLTDLGAVSEVTEGISYQPGDGLSNLST
jgi:hypothetical protein